MGRLGELLVILAIVLLLFGSRRLKDFGSDLGAAIKGFKDNIGDDEQKMQQTAREERHLERRNDEGVVIDGKAEPVKPGDHTKP